MLTYLFSFSDGNVSNVLSFVSWVQFQDVLNGGVWVLIGQQHSFFFVLVQRLHLESNLTILQIKVGSQFYGNIDLTELVVSSDVTLLVVGSDETDLGLVLTGIPGNKDR